MSDTANWPPALQRILIGDGTPQQKVKRAILWLAPRVAETGRLAEMQMNRPDLCEQPTDWCATAKQYVRGLALIVEMSNAAGYPLRTLEHAERLVQYVANRPLRKPKTIPRMFSDSAYATKPEQKGASHE